MSLLKSLRLAPLALMLASWTGVAAGKTCELAIEGTDAMQFNTKELTVEKSCTEVKVTLKHTGKLPKAAMGHNWVLTSDKDAPGVIADGMKAGLTKEYVPAGDARVIASTKLVGGGESTTTSFKMAALKAGEAYKFFCTFPGHSGLMSGVLIVK